MASGGDENRNLNATPDSSLDDVAVNDLFVDDCLRDACHLGDLQTLQSIVKGLQAAELPAVFNRPSKSAGTPLFEAVIGQRLEIVQYILSLNVCDLEQECYINVVYPIMFRDKSAVLALACACGSVPIVRELLDHGADVNHPSEHSSPMIYASECNNVELLSLLLNFGADMSVVPQSLQVKTTLLPLYQACLYGHLETAQLLMDSASIEIDKKIALLGLLGAQVINCQSDFISGVSFWRQALQLLEGMSDTDKLKSGDALDLVTKFQRLGVNDLPAELPSASGGGETDTGLTSTCGAFSKVKMCSNVAELDAISEDDVALRLQALVVLEKILGPSHPQVTEQVSHAGRHALESGDLTTACVLFLYIVESNLSRQQVTTSIENASQMADLLLKIHLDGNSALSGIANFGKLLLSALDFTQQAAKLTYSVLDGGQPNMENIGIPYIQHFSKVKLLSEMTETFVAFLKLIKTLTLTCEQTHQLHSIVQGFLSLGRHPGASKYNVESEIFKLVVHGGRCASSTLYFFQDDILPDVQILQLLLQCGGYVNCQDTVCGDTPLHFSLDCLNPRADIVQLLLDYQAHLDIHNEYGVTPLHLLAKRPVIRINKLHYISLKCLAAQTIMMNAIPFKGHIPRSLEEFIPWHGVVLSTPRSPIGGK